MSRGAGRCASTARLRRRTSASPPTASCSATGCGCSPGFWFHARDELGAEAFPFHNHRRAAKRWALRVSRRRGKRRRAAYRELLGIARRTLGYLHGALEAVEEREVPVLRDWRAKSLQYGELLGRVVDQAERRVLRDEKVPAQEKVASLFEPHTDIIVKGGRKVQYGHKVNLSTGKSGLVLDAVVERGNPADSSRCLAMIERHAEIYGAVPKQVACDAGYASKHNLREAKALGVTDMVFERKRGLHVADMASTPGVYDKLRRFRAGIEAATRISSAASAFAAATGGGSITSGPTSGRPSLPTTWRCWPAAR